MTYLDSRQGLPSTMSLLTISAIAIIGIILAMSVIGIWGWQV